jgi:hypothetical protein
VARKWQNASKIDAALGSLHDEKCNILALSLNLPDSVLRTSESTRAHHLQNPLIFINLLVGATGIEPVTPPV